MSNTSPHYFIVTIGTTGDMYPFLRIAKTLQTLGRKVTFITNFHYENLIRDAGIPFAGAGTEEEFFHTLNNPNIWDPKKGLSTLFAHYSNQLKQYLDAIESASIPTPQVIIAHPLVISGAIIARELNLVKSVVSAYLAPSNLKTCYDPLTIGMSSLSVPRWVPMSWRRGLWWFIEKQRIDPFAVTQVNAARIPLGLPKIHSFLTHIAQAPDLTVTLFPSWFAPTAPDWPRSLIEGDFQLFDTTGQQSFSKELSDFLEAGEKPIVFTPGTGNFHAAKFFACALAAINKIGRRAIFLTKNQAQIPSPLPQSVLWQPYVPLSALLKHTAALVHHGGVGTTAEALRSGTPQLITPFAWDQFDNGTRVTSLGAGRVIPVKKLRPQNLAQELHTLCTSEPIAIQCARLSSHFTSPHYSIALWRKIEQFIFEGNL
ncbi:glycosyl transferase family protein [Candidatus Nitrosoglobus terrae]|uniref:Glycosyl transferase family protein n=1 Tax=Candidatus Nitrosoglobus terrae TaxID=1630141 RepID=A0A1Q2SL77_9GAMM|nr:glycosyltransferase [Candidatus Nitrosoglobus terrae]BAW79859.1 glycosyl transferase family protein [Candidatus Nitrosoglobus terrae]